MLWDLQGNLLWQTRIRARFFLLVFSSTYLLAVTQQGKALKWDIDTGELLDERAFRYQPLEDDKTTSGIPSKAPYAAAVSPGLELIALAYRNSPVCVYDAETTDFISWALDGNKRCPQYLIFHPNSDVTMLLVIYNDSHMCLFDSWTGDLVNKYKPEKDVISISATSSPNGHTFATVNVQGALRIWDFESLTVLYRVQTPNNLFRMLQFTSDSSSLLDATDHEMKLWSPSAIRRQTFEEENSNSNSNSDQPQAAVAVEGQFETLDMSKIRAFRSHPKHPVFFVGKNNGELSLYNLTDGKEAGVLYTHQDAVDDIVSCRENVIASCDVFNIVQVWTLIIRRSNIIQAEQLKLKTRAVSPIHQLLLDDDGEYLLVSTTKADIVYRTSNGMIIGSMNWDGKERNSWRWVTMHDKGKGPVFALVHNRTLSRYTASEFPKTSPEQPISLDYAIEEGLEEISMDAVFLNPSTRHLVLQYSQGSKHSAHSSMSIFQLPPATGAALPLTSPLTISALPHFLSSKPKYALGFATLNEIFVFLGRDSWVCSIPISGDTSRYTRHFFVPSEFTTTNKKMMPIRASGDSFLFCLFDKIAIIKNGLKFQKIVDVETSSTY